MMDAYPKLAGLGSYLTQQAVALSGMPWSDDALVSSHREQLLAWARELIKPIHVLRIAYPRDAVGNMTASNFLDWLNCQVQKSWEESKYQSLPNRIEMPHDVLRYMAQQIIRSGFINITILDFVKSNLLTSAVGQGPVEFAGYDPTE